MRIYILSLLLKKNTGKVEYHFKTIVIDMFYSKEVFLK